jgi:hypothetical protein
MIKLEFGDAMRRLRDGEALVASHPKRANRTFIWDARGLWVYPTSGDWVVVTAELALDIIMTSTWYLRSESANPLPPRPIGPAPDPV